MKRPFPAGFRHAQTPENEDQLRSLIENAARANGVLRVVGSSHSVPAAIAESGDTLVSLERMRSVLDYDAETGRLTVQAGMTLGPCPLWPDRPVSETLGGYLEAQARQAGRGWALPDVGGITHQTVGGFLSTGSSGGSLQYSLAEAIERIRFIDGLGQIHEAHRGEDLFNAVAVSMGLLGVITAVTFQCVEWFDIIGRETTTLSADCEVDLFGDGPRSLRPFLARTPYTRLLWFPQPGVDKVTLWQARRMEAPDYLAQHSTPIELKARPYEALGTLGQIAVDAFFSILALRFGPSPLDRWIESITPFVVRTVMNLSYPVTSSDPQLFWDSWNKGLPMDDKSSQLVPTDFTELWIPIDRTQQAMVALRNHYRDNGWAAAGTYACEIYGARSSPFWLSPAYATDVLRVDVFWFAKNQEDAATGYYPQFWSVLKPFEFRPHWGKTLPAADSDTGLEYMRGLYPRWDDFMALRSQLDPHGIFASTYWQEHLGIGTTRAGSRESMVVPRGAKAPEPEASVRQSG